jgi:hypothetical protein
MIDRADARGYINIYQARWYTLKAQRERRYGKPNDVLQLIKDALADFKDNALDIAVYDKGYGHSVVPYRIEQNGNIAKVYVYDNNHPNSESQYIEIDASMNKWSYDSLGWQGTESSSIYVDLAKNNFPAYINISRSKFRQDNIIPTVTQIIIDGNISSIFTDDDGNRLGIVDGQVIDEIDNSNVAMLPAYDPNQPDALASVIYMLPLTQSYTLQTYSKNTGSYTVTAFADGIATQISDVDTAVGVTDEIVFGENLRQMTLEAAGNKKNFCYFFADDKLNDASRSFDLCTTTSPGGTATFNVASDNNQLTYENSGQSADYSLTIAQTGQQSGSQTITGKIDSTTPLNVVAVNGSGPGGSDWVTDATVRTKIYLPIIIK